MTPMELVDRSAVAEWEWDHQGKHWRRPDIDLAAVKALSERSTLDGLLRVGLFVGLLGASAAATVYASRISPWLAIVPLYVYYFFYGFWVAIGHELQHKTVFGRSFERFGEAFFFVVQTFMWNSPRYARVSHRLHHRYTMVRGIDPETPWPETITSRWLRGFLGNLILNILVIGALRELYRAVLTHLRRAIGRKDEMMQNHCTPQDFRAIRIESAAILAIHAGVAALAVIFRRWEPLLFVTLAWQIGSSIEGLWHNTEHIGRLYNVNDQRLCTRSIRVSPFLRLIYWGLDDHVDHHLFPSVPSRNLPQLHRLLQKDLAEPRNIIGCWKEMFAIAREKDRQPRQEFVPVPLEALRRSGKLARIREGI